MLSFGIGESENGVLLAELGADWGQYQRSGGTRPILTDYPLMSRLDGDIANDAWYAPSDVEPLYAEYLRAQRAVTDPRSVRGLDKLIRIARWAQKLKVGICFGGQ
jgi:hypothetical protein